ncbi:MULTISPECIES: GNAT family N-acetyltransferase [unclassified Dysgonomonas]|uniref:GNAT family N-acetyltransferase n=1 Tax=unclassified Dysgonomonas TaxID=2630389 RepID=UPI0006820C67|nr:MULTISPECIES: GNAT family N-acetyltransferase [unclassified Dysgonomonas]MBD8348762.1 GNAT family N-acetyltransferase [Dysgonomonas sp. HGC4]MBF0576229.1 GNAT family N-acetyltransferase [Dysgonomonas sp. GY617]
MINEVAYADVLEIRHKVMYPDKDKDYVILPDDDKGLHIGYYKEGILVSVLSLFLNNRELQFRKFATLPEYQGQGYGTELVKWVLDYAKDMQFDRVWCNSRIEKTDFYKKFDFVETDEIFEKDGRKFIILERKFKQEA